MAIVKGGGGGGKSMPKPKIVKAPAPKIPPKKTGLSNVIGGASVTRPTGFSGVTGGAGVTRPQPWQSGIYGGIPPEARYSGPAWSNGVYGGVPTGFTNVTGSASTFLKTMKKPPTYYAPHEPMSSYYPPDAFTLPQTNIVAALTEANAWSGGGGGWGGGGGGYGDGYGFTMGLINWRI